MTLDIDPDDLVTVTDADGAHHEFVLFAVFEFEGSDFAVLAPRDELEAEGEGQLQLFFFQYEVRDLQHFFVEIEDEGLYVRARDEFMKMAQQADRDDAAEA